MYKVINQANAQLQRGLDKVDVSLGRLENDSPACPQGWRTRKGAVGAVSRQMRGVKQVHSRSYITSSFYHYYCLFNNLLHGARGPAVVATS